jgi:GNAT superfamily N-acetyltransferase
MLRDGTAVTVRPIEVTDGPGLVRFHESLSFETIRSRFFGIHPHLSSAEAEHFTTVDHHEREAMVGIVAGEIVAVGRYEHLDGGGDAEVAFVVADGWQRRGIASILLELLAARARREGISRFIAETLGDNLAMIKVFRSSGLAMTTSWAGGQVHVTMTL